MGIIFVGRVVNNDEFLSELSSSWLSNLEIIFPCWSRPCLSRHYVLSALSDVDMKGSCFPPYVSWILVQVGMLNTTAWFIVAVLQVMALKGSMLMCSVNWDIVKFPFFLLLLDILSSSLQFDLRTHTVCFLFTTRQQRQQQQPPPPSPSMRAYFFCSSSFGLTLTPVSVAEEGETMSSKSVSSSSWRISTKTWFSQQKVLH